MLEGFIVIFLLQDLLEEKDLSVKFFLPFLDFDKPPVPSNVKEYEASKNT